MTLHEMVSGGDPGGITMVTEGKKLKSGPDEGSKKRR
jgi:hypothetical protein